jgi:hypothetical protein
MFVIYQVIFRNLHIIVLNLTIGNRWELVKTNFYTRKKLTHVRKQQFFMNTCKYKVRKRELKPL